MLASLLGALYQVPKRPDLPVVWHDRPPRRELTWRAWLLQGLTDAPEPAAQKWRAALSAETEAHTVFGACEARIRDLVEACPERRDLVHGDLLHANVLVAEDANRVNELHIGATHLGWYLRIGDLEGLHRVAVRLEDVLDRGPLALST